MLAKFKFVLIFGTISIISLLMNDMKLEILTMQLKRGGELCF